MPFCGNDTMLFFASILHFAVFSLATMSYRELNAIQFLRLTTGDVFAK
jgi:hypothetical protein